ncbi:MAG: DUF5719 family protein [Angustibacter sp.]
MTADSRGASAFVIRGTGPWAPGLAADQTTVVRDGDLRGLASTSCGSPSDDLWFVGGGGEVGRRGRLVMANPGVVTARVTIDVLTSSGAVARSPGSAVAIPADSRVVVLLDALAPGAVAPVVRVRSSGAPVVATLHDAWLDGLVPRGTDDVTAAAPPATETTIAGFSPSGPGPGKAAVRLAVPGEQAAVVQLQLHGPRGPVDLSALPDDGVVRVPASSTLDVDLSAVPAGDYAVRVRADVPVLAGGVVEQRRRWGGPADFAWAASSVPVTGLSGVPPTSQASASVVVVATGTAAAVLDVVSVAEDRTTRSSSVQVAPGSTRVVPLTPDRTTWFTPRAGSGPAVLARQLRLADDAGQLISTSPVRTSVVKVNPPDIAPADG